MKNKPSQPSFLIYPKVLDKKKTLAALAVKASVYYGLFVFFVYSIFFSISSFFLQRILVKGVEHG